MDRPAGRQQQPPPPQQQQQPPPQPQRQPAAVFFYSTGTLNPDLSGMSEAYPFVFDPTFLATNEAFEALGENRRWLRAAGGVRFRTREHFFAFAKAMLAGAPAVAYGLLQGSPFAAKRATGRRGLQGLDTARWDAVSDYLVFRAALMQATQNSGLARRLLGTGGAVLAEAGPDVGGAGWAIGFDAEQAAHVPREHWRANRHGDALMRARAALRDGEPAWGRERRPPRLLPDGEVDPDDVFD